MEQEDRRNVAVADQADEMTEDLLALLADLYAPGYPRMLLNLAFQVWFSITSRATRTVGYFHTGGEIQ